MAGSFETTEDQASLKLKTLHLPTLIGDLYAAAREMVDDLSGWELVSEELGTERGVITCVKRGGALKGTSTITITLEAPEGMPSTKVNVRSVTEGGVLSRDKANVAEFLEPYNRRVC